MSSGWPKWQDGNWGLGGSSGFCSLRKCEISVGELVRDLHCSAARGHNIWTFCEDMNAAKRPSLLFSHNSAWLTWSPPPPFGFIDMLQIDQDVLAEQSKKCREGGNGRGAKWGKRQLKKGSWLKESGWKNREPEDEWVQTWQDIHLFWAPFKKRAQMKWTKWEWASIS